MNLDGAVSNPGGSVTSSVAALTVLFPVLAAHPDGLDCGTLSGTATSLGAPFAVVAGGAFSVFAGQSTNVTVEFAPSTPGRCTNQIVFASNGGNSTNRVTGPALTLFEAWQFEKFGCFDCPPAAPDADPDGDGFTNYQEFLAGTDPTNPGSVFRFTAMEWSGQDLRLWWDAVGGKSYIVEATSSLGGSYTNLSGTVFVPTTGPTNDLDSGAVTNGQRFYRLRLQ